MNRKWWIWITKPYVWNVKASRFLCEPFIIDSMNINYYHSFKHRNQVYLCTSRRKVAMLSLLE
jgi:hypothetical protein